MTADTASIPPAPSSRPSFSAPSRSGIDSLPRLLALEARRKVAWPLALLGAGAAAGAALLTRSDSQVWLWTDASHGLLDVTFFVRAFCAGAGAWAASRTWLRGIGDLLETVPRPAAARELTVLGATTLWWLLALALVGASVFVKTAFHATWGAPPLWPVLLAALVVVAATTIGYALGLLLPGWLVPALAGGAVLTLSLIGATMTPARYLAVVDPFPNDEALWFRIDPDPAPRQALWLLGLTVLGLAAILRRRAPDRVAYPLLALGLVGTVGGGALLYGRVPTWSGSWYPHASTRAQMASAEFANLAYVPYEPVCHDGAIPVCLHPAYEAALPEVAAMVNRLAEPVLGLPGLPTRAEQTLFAKTMEPPPGVIALDLDNTLGPEFLPRQIANRLSPDIGPASPAIAHWLIQRAGYPSWCDGGYPGADGEQFRATCDAAARFATWSPAQQRAWLESNLVKARTRAVQIDEVPSAAL